MYTQEQYESYGKKMYAKGIHSGKIDMYNIFADEINRYRYLNLKVSNAWTRLISFVDGIHATLTK
jgi:hypothetical protein